MRRVDEIGWAGACAEFNDSAGAYVDRDLHVLALDREGVCHAVAVHPQWIGRRLDEACTDAASDHAREFVRAAWSGVTEQGAWVRYQDAWSVDGELTSKVAFVMQMNADILMACSCPAFEGMQLPAPGQWLGKPRTASSEPAVNQRADMQVSPA